MLIINRFKNQRVRIDDDITVQILDIDLSAVEPVVVLAFDAPRSKRIICEENYQKNRKEEKANAANGDQH